MALVKTFPSNFWNSCLSLSWSFRKLITRCNSDPDLNGTSCSSPVCWAFLRVINWRPGFPQLITSGLGEVVHTLECSSGGSRELSGKLPFTIPCLSLVILRDLNLLCNFKEPQFQLLGGNSTLFHPQGTHAY